MSRDNYQRSLGAFAKLRKATLHSFVMSTRPRGTIRAPNGRIFMKFYIRVFFENLSRTFWVWNL